MRRIAWAFALPLLPLACFDPGSPTTLDLDAALPQVEFPDGTALPNVVIFSPSVPEADAGPVPEAGMAVDVGVDGQPSVGTVTVTVLSDLGPEANAQITASDADGNLLGTPTQTDATGTAKVTVTAGASVTATLTNQGKNDFVTYADVSPGDTLTVYDTDDFRYSDLSVQVNGTPDSTFQSGWVGDCDFNTNGSPPYLVYPQPGCFLGGIFPVLLVEPPNVYSFQKGNSLAGFTGTAISLDLSSGSVLTDGASEKVNAINPPAQLADLGVFLSYTEVANNVPYWAQFQNPLSFTGDGGTSASAQFDTHPQYPDFVQTQAQIFALNDSQNGPYWSVVKRSATPSASDTLDLSGLASVVAGANFVEYPDTGGIQVAWSTVGSISHAIGTLVRVTGGCGSWSFVVPPGATSVSAPRLPGYSGLFSGECEGGNYDVAILSGSTIADYAHFKAVAGPMVDMMAVPQPTNGCGGFSAPPLPTDGALTITGYQTGLYSVCNPP